MNYKNGVIDPNIPPLIIALTNIADQFEETNLVDIARDYDESVSKLVPETLNEIKELNDFEELNTYSTAIYNYLPESNTKSLLLQQINVSMLMLARGNKKSNEIEELSLINKKLNRIMKHNSITEY